ncbi:hypothetical protein QA640_19415 [Bradyrhizobium sp. CB82]|uniref:hypothetical protein n=1 Tax=Bradyrhizobium sp. CB82 TaxID=3039159 RepID=UPI0024B0CC9F|nr:hypothetical protein [Bradyrhizobium sp. CB82]WFU44416.1 hypothetical protein QA640_19415 [Bradyrhizobium sp. CB82]
MIAVSGDHFADWIKFAGGRSVKLRCDRHALDTWSDRLATRAMPGRGRAFHGLRRAEMNLDRGKVGA